MLSSLSPVCHNSPLILWKSPQNNDVYIPGKYVQYLHSLQRDGIRLIYNQYLKNSGIVLNDNNEHEKIVLIILFLTAVSRKTDSLPSVIICPKQRVYHWKFNLDIWSENNLGISIVDQEEVGDIVKYKWNAVVIDDLNPSIIMNQLRQMKCQFKIWNANEDLSCNLPLLHTIGNLIGIIDNGSNRETFFRKFSYSNKPYHEAVRSLQLLHAFCEPWLIRSRENRSDFVKPSVYNHYFVKWKNENNISDLNEVDKLSDQYPVQRHSLENTLKGGDVTENNKQKRSTKDATGLKIKRSKKPEKDASNDKTDIITLKHGDNPTKNDISTSNQDVSEVSANEKTGLCELHHFSTLVNVEQKNVAVLKDKDVVENNSKNDDIVINNNNTYTTSVNEACPQKYCKDISKNKSQTLDFLFESKSKNRNLVYHPKYGDKDDENAPELKGVSPPKRRFLECLFD